MYIHVVTYAHLLKLLFFLQHFNDFIDFIDCCLLSLSVVLLQVFFFSILFLFSRGLDLSKYVVNEDHVKPIYDLFAVSNHFGGMGGGHCKPHPQHTYYVNNNYKFVCY